jgi:signal transduction histidine kinase
VGRATTGRRRRPEDIRTHDHDTRSASDEDRVTKNAERRGRESGGLSSLLNLASGVAHEINNPLNAISIASQLIQKLLERRAVLGPDDEIRKHFAVIHLEVGRIRKVIDNFVQFSRIENLTLEPLSIDEIVRGVLIPIRDLSERAGLRLEESIEGDAIVAADRGRLHEALLHVLDNAVQSTEPGGNVSIGLKVLARSVRIVVRDSGRGIPIADIDQIFEPYYSTQVDRLGLGLTLARSIVRGHRGRIRVRSQVGLGTEFTIWIPRVRGSDDPAASAGTPI